jgi:hypothetical protein
MSYRARTVLAAAAVLLLIAFAWAKRSNLPVTVLAPALAETPAAAHPDLSGTWAYTVALPPLALKRSADGKASVKGIDSGRADAAQIKGALPSTAEPSYKPEFLAKVKDLEEHESKTDPVFYCDKPGVPRIGPPRRIVQLPNEVLFLYEDMSGDAYRVIPTDGRPHRVDANPSYYGHSVAHWEGDTLVVDARNFVEDTWFGENGYFHSDAMRVVERFWRDGANLVYQATVYDPKVLTGPWTMAPRVVKPSTEALEESPKCVESDSKLLVNNDHHIQR